VALSPDRHHSKISVHSNSFIKSFFVVVCLVQPSDTTWPTLGILFFLGIFNQLFAQDPAFSFNLARPARFHGYIENEHGLYNQMMFNTIKDVVRTGRSVHGN
jgi:hypothetical protein